MQPNEPPVKLIAAASPVLNKWSSGWYIFGAQAVVIWGQPRQTADVDVTIRLRPEDALPFWREMEAAGFKLRVSEPEDFIARTRVMPFIHLETGMPLDVVLAGPGLENIFLQRVVRIREAGLELPVASAEDIVIMKVLAGRPKDIGDVRSILQQRIETLDFAYIREMLAMLEGALDQSDLLRSLEAELKRIRGGQ